MKSFYLLLMAAVINFSACRTKEGEPGPAGESSLNKQGAISGKLAYVNQDGDPLEQSFSYQYFATLTEGYFTIDEEYDQYSISIFRRDLKDSERRFELILRGNTDQSGNPTAVTNGRIRFSYVNVINNDLFSFATYESSGLNSIYFDEGKSSTKGVISNFSFNKTTGRLIFDYTFTVSPGDIANESRYDSDMAATITGHVDVVVSKKQVPI